ncbi:MAG: alkaline phosphatase family protein [Campylobacteraceae bacterium]|nr:alkaline phosphatase family protein [Campylobacteraceae bacterium]
MSKVILVVLDGLSYSASKECMGFLTALINEKKGKLYKVTSELPSISRPLYECILTGVKPVHSGIVHNSQNFMSKNRSIFHYAKDAGLKAGAAAYYWVSELYNRSPFDINFDRHVEDTSLTIPYASFYYDDSYPDSHLFSDAESLRVKFNLDFLLIHPMNIDDAGHKFGHDSKEYRNKARIADGILSLYLQKWLDEGYSVIVTSDHGMNDDHSHGGVLECEVEVPLYLFGDAFSFEECEVKQTEICGTICEILDIKHDKEINKSLLKEIK